jgi:hypothetical protein
MRFRALCRVVVDMKDLQKQSGEPGEYVKGDTVVLPEDWDYMWKEKMAWIFESACGTRRRVKMQMMR